MLEQKNKIMGNVRILRAGNRLRVLNLGKRDPRSNDPSEFKDGDSTIGLLKEDFSDFGSCIKLLGAENFWTDPIIYITPTKDGRLILTSMTYCFLIEVI